MGCAAIVGDLTVPMGIVTRDLRFSLGRYPGGYVIIEYMFFATATAHASYASVATARCVATQYSSLESIPGVLPESMSSHEL